jgi:hypothetical protein
MQIVWLAILLAVQEFYGLGVEAICCAVAGRTVYD